jgi:N-acetylneuraminic acid mutarotase
MLRLSIFGFSLLTGVPAAQSRGKAIVKAGGGHRLLCAAYRRAVSRRLSQSVVLLAAVCLASGSMAAAQTAGEWTWMGGSSTVGTAGGHPGVYGTLGKAAAGNVPGSRSDAANWIDSSGHLWLSGGNGFDEKGVKGILNDLWEFNPSTNQWAWVGGSSTAGSDCVDSTVCGWPGVYGKLGTAAAGNMPGSRFSAAFSADKSGIFWLFGGTGLDASGTYGSLNDLWKFNPSTKQWTWMGGSSSSGAHRGQPGVYGTLGAPAAGNTPGGRSDASGWADRSGHFWLFGGFGYDATETGGNLNDFWEFNPSTMEWAWMGGSSNIGNDCGYFDGDSYLCGQPGVYGTLGLPEAGNIPGGSYSATSWTDSGGNFWLFGGEGFGAAGDAGSINTLWEFSPSTGEWTWINGASTADQAGMTGTLGSPGPGNVPGARDTAISWTDASGHLWLFGGYGFDATGGYGDLNDLWEFNPAIGAWAWMGGSRGVVNDLAGQPGVYGTLGTSAAGDVPGARTSAATWTGSDGRLWLSGGAGYDEKGVYGLLNDLWVYRPASASTVKTTTTTITASQATAVYRDWVTFTARVTGNGGSPENGELVWFTDGAALLGTGQLSGGAASFETNLLPAGTDSIAAVYNGDSTLAASVSKAAVETVSKADTATILTSSANPSSLAELVTFTATVTWGASFQFAPGTMIAVTFKDGATVLGTVPLYIVCCDPDTVTFSISDLQKGAHSITAAYAGDSNYASDVSKPVKQTVDAEAFAAHDWTLVDGNDSLYGEYGALGAPAIGNMPGSRAGSAEWTDIYGHFWIFGGCSGLLDGCDLFNDAWEFNAATDEWTWVGGSSTAGNNCLRSSANCGSSGVYGTLGKPAAGNNPGGRYQAANWTASGGNFWLFGGLGLDAAGNFSPLNDLWEFSPFTKEWTWMGGSTNVVNACIPSRIVCGQPGVYGKLGAPAAGNSPGSRYAALTWTGSSGNFWLFGGVGFDGKGNYGDLNDLWELDPASREWAWMGGSSTVGANCDPSTGTCGQPGEYGKPGVPAAGNSPGGRGNAVSWTDSKGNLWLHGGWGFDARGSYGDLNDLWEFNPSTKEWAWIAGSSTLGSACDADSGICGRPGVYGKLGAAATGNVPGGRTQDVGWTGKSGNFWLFGGYGFDGKGIYGALNDLWEFDLATKEWTWMGGGSATVVDWGVFGVEGTPGVPAAGNIPGSLWFSTGWTDANGDLWLFGGAGFGETGSDNGTFELNELWRYQP